MNVLNALGSSLSLILDGVDAGVHTATIATNNADTAGTTGLQYAFTARVGGGTPLYNTSSFGAFLSADYTSRSTVPEPASWAMLIAGFGMIGGALRHQRSNVRFV